MGKHEFLSLLSLQQRRRLFGFPLLDKKTGHDNPQAGILGLFITPGKNIVDFLHVAGSGIVLIIDVIERNPVGILPDCLFQQFIRLSGHLLFPEIPCRFNLSLPAGSFQPGQNNCKKKKERYGKENKSEFNYYFHTLPRFTKQAMD